MVNGDRTKGHRAEKISLLVIFIISLLTAWLVIELRSVTRLSAPIELSYSGLSISIPSGNGWQSEGKWMYDDDSFTLRSVFVVVGDTGRSYARCRYLLAAQKQRAQERFDEEANAVGGEAVETGQIATGELVVDWAKIKGSVRKTRRTSAPSGAGIAAVPFEVILGICELPAGRQLEIEVIQTADAQRLAQHVFEQIVKGIRFSGNGLLQAGVRLVGEVRRDGLDNVLASGESGESQGQPVFFVLYDTRDQAIGFTMDATVVSQTDSTPSASSPQADANAEIKAASYYYMRGTVPDEQVSVFRGDAAFEKFAWRVESNSRAGRKGVEMSAEAGVLTVLKSGAGSEENEYVLGETAVPDIVIEPVFRKMLDGDRTAIIVDVIRPDGTITPVYVEKMKPTEQQADSNSIRVELLDGRGFWQQTYYDSSKRPVKTMLGQEGTYTLKRADVNEITKVFPERAELVRNRGRLLDREGL